MVKIVCRCHDVTLEEIEEAIEKYKVKDLETLKRILRIGMGECQGRTCLPIVLGILARKTGKSPEELANPSSRPPAFPTKIGAFAGVNDDEEI